jgi:hypothetical protein
MASDMSEFLVQAVPHSHDADGQAVIINQPESRLENTPGIQIGCVRHIATTLDVFFHSRSSIVDRSAAEPVLTISYIDKEFAQPTRKIL